MKVSNMSPVKQKKFEWLIAWSAKWRNIWGSSVYFIISLSWTLHDCSFTKEAVFPQPLAVMVPSWEWWCAVHPIEGEVLLMVSHHSSTTTLDFPASSERSLLAWGVASASFCSWLLEGKLPIMQQVSLAFIKLCLHHHCLILLRCSNSFWKLSLSQPWCHTMMSWCHGHGSVDTIIL